MKRHAILVAVCFAAGLLGSNVQPVLTGAGKILFPENATPANITASSGAITIAAGGSNQNVVTSPSGTGFTVLGGKVGVDGVTTPAHALDVTGDINASGSLLSQVSTGTAPLTVASTTPVANLTAVPVTYGAPGTQSLNVHVLIGSVSLTGGTATLALSGAAVFTSNATFHCAGADQTAIAAVKITPSTGSSIVFGGTGTDTVGFICIGN